MMLGHLMEWFYSGLGGIYQKENSIAYSDIIIAPKPVGDIKWVKCSYNSLMGLISSVWEKTDEILSLKIKIPESSSASVVIPEGYLSSSCELFDLSNNKRLNPVIINDTFNVTPGYYQVLVKKE
jgi:hypothetical protein